MTLERQPEPAETSRASQEAPAASSSPLLHRRGFIRQAVAGSLGVMAVVTGGGEAAEAQRRKPQKPSFRNTAIRSTPSSIAASEARKNALQEARQNALNEKFLLLDGETEGRAGEEALQQRSAIAARGLRLVPVRFSILLARCSKDSELIIPCPRNCVDQQHVGAAITGWQGNRQVDVPRMQIIYGNGDPETSNFKNPFYHVSGMGQSMKLQVDTYVLMPTYQWSLALLNVARNRMLASPVGGAVRAGCMIQWQSVPSRMDPQTLRTASSGDCSVKAGAVVERAKGSGVPVVVWEGFGLPRPYCESVTGTHTVNGVLAPEGWWMVDPCSEEKSFVGPPDNFLVTSVGCRNIVPWKNWDPYDGTNAPFAYHVTAAGLMQVSVPGWGPEGGALSQVNIPPSIAALAKAMTQERMAVYT